MACALTMAACWHSKCAHVSLLVQAGQSVPYSQQWMPPQHLPSIPPSYLSAPAATAIRVRHRVRFCICGCARPTPHGALRRNPKVAFQLQTMLQSRPRSASTTAIYVSAAATASSPGPSTSPIFPTQLTASTAFQPCLTVPSLDDIIIISADNFASQLAKRRKLERLERLLHSVASPASSSQPSHGASVPTSTATPPQQYARPLPCRPQPLTPPSGHQRKFHLAAHRIPPAQRAAWLSQVRSATAPLTEWRDARSTVPQDTPTPPRQHTTDPPHRPTVQPDLKLHHPILVTPTGIAPRIEPPGPATRSESASIGDLPPHMQTIQRHAGEMATKGPVASPAPDSPVRGQQPPRSTRAWAPLPQTPLAAAGAGPDSPAPDQPLLRRSAQQALSPRPGEMGLAGPASLHLQMVRATRQRTASSQPGGRDVGAAVGPDRRRGVPLAARVQQQQGPGTLQLGVGSEGQTPSQDVLIRVSAMAVVGEVYRDAAREEAPLKQLDIATRQSDALGAETEAVVTDTGSAAASRLELVAGGEMWDSSPVSLLGSLVQQHGEGEGEGGQHIAQPQLPGCLAPLPAPPETLHGHSTQGRSVPSTATAPTPSAGMVATALSAAANPSEPHIPTPMSQLREEPQQQQQQQQEPPIRYHEQHPHHQPGRSQPQLPLPPQQQLQPDTESGLLHPQQADGGSLASHGGLPDVASSALAPVLLPAAPKLAAGIQLVPRPHRPLLDDTPPPAAGPVPHTHKPAPPASSTAAVGQLATGHSASVAGDAQAAVQQLQEPQDGLLLPKVESLFEFQHFTTPGEDTFSSSYTLTAPPTTAIPTAWAPANVTLTAPPTSQPPPLQLLRPPLLAASALPPLPSSSDRTRLPAPRTHHTDPGRLMSPQDLTASLFDSPSWVHVARLVHRWPHCLNAVSLAAALKRLSTCCDAQMLDPARSDSTALSSMLQHLCFQAEHHLPDMRPRELSTVLFSLAKLGYLPPPDLTTALIDALLRQLPAANAVDCAQTLWALQELGWPLGPGQLAAVWGRGRACLGPDERSRRSLLILLTTATKLGLRLCREELLWVESQLVCHVDRLSSQDVANALACLARLADSQRPGASEQQQQPVRGTKQPQMTAAAGGSRGGQDDNEAAHHNHRAGSHAPPQPQTPDNTAFGAAPAWARQGPVHGQQPGTVSGGGGGAASAGAGRDVGRGRPGEDALVGGRGGTGRGGVRPQPATLVALLRRCAVVLPSLRPDEAAMSLYSLGRLRFHAPHGFTASLLSRCADLRSACSPHSLPLMLWAAGRLPRPPGSAWQDALLHEALHVRLHDFTPPQISTLMYAIAQLRAGVRLGPHTAGPLLQRARAALPYMSAQEVANTVWAVAYLSPDCHPTHGSDFWAVLHGRCLQLGFRSFTGQGLANLLWGLAAVAAAQQPSTADSTSDNFPAFRNANGNGNVNVADDGSAVPRRRPLLALLSDGNALRDLEAALAARLPFLNHVEMGMMLWALARLGLRPGPDWLAAAARRAGQMAADMSVEGLCAATHALTWMLPYVPDVETVEALEEAVATHAANIDSRRTLIGLVSRLSYMRARLRERQRAVSHAALVRADVARKRARAEAGVLRVTGGGRIQQTEVKGAGAKGNGKGKAWARVGKGPGSMSKVGPKAPQHAGFARREAKGFRIGQRSADKT